MKMFEIASFNKITSSERERDKIWIGFAAQVAKDLGTTPRGATAAAEHFKDMVKVVRSLSSLYPYHFDDSGLNSECPDSRDVVDFDKK
jgi:hypothetical protein